MVELEAAHIIPFSLHSQVLVIIGTRRLFLTLIHTARLLLHAISRYLLAGE